METFKEFRDKKELEKWNYWLVFENNDEAFHCVGFIEEPNKEDIKDIIGELKSNSNFQIQDDILSNMSYSIMNKKDGLEVISKLD